MDAIIRSWISIKEPSLELLLSSNARCRLLILFKSKILKSGLPFGFTDIHDCLLFYSHYYWLIFFFFLSFFGGLKWQVHLRIKISSYFPISSCPSKDFLISLDAYIIFSQDHDLYLREKTTRVPTYGEVPFKHEKIRFLWWIISSIPLVWKLSSTISWST